MIKSLLFILPFVLAVTACGPKPGTDTGEDVPVIETLHLVPTSVENIKPYSAADIDGFARAVQKSCDRIMTLDASKSYGPTVLGGTVADWQAPCQNAGPNAGRAWLDQYFTAYTVYDNDDVQGLFTGYYEPLLHGSKTQSAKYHTPLYKMPNDIIEVDLGLFSEDLEGKKISGRVQNNRLIPYADRMEIDEGALDNRDLELVWVDDAVDAFFLQIQGSGQVQMQDGSIMRVGYAGQNGRSYYAIGRDLIKRGALTKENVSLQTIRAWLDENPDQAAEVMQLNPSYIFFHELKGDGPLGAQGVALTPMASLAVDRRLYPYGMPVLLQAEEPLSDNTITRLMVAQDTGGAIRGAVRGDVFWGAGEQAALKAGHMKSQGRFWIFLPKTIKIPPELIGKPR